MSWGTGVSWSLPQNMALHMQFRSYLVMGRQHRDLLRESIRVKPHGNQANFLITSVAAPWPKSHQDHWHYVSTYLRNTKFLLLPSIRQQHKCASIDYEIWTQKCQSREVICLKHFVFLSEGKVDMEWSEKHLPFIAFSQGKKFWTNLNSVLLLFLTKCLHYLMKSMIILMLNINPPSNLKKK